MKVYIAHSFHSYGPTTRLRDRNDPDLVRFFSRLSEVSIDVLDPAETPLPACESRARFDYCIRELGSADVLVVDATDRLGVGAGAEMMYARVNGIRTVSVCPAPSYYRRSNVVDKQEWVHPFIDSLSTTLVASFEECATLLIEIRGTS
jgi:hypothetical protein